MIEPRLITHKHPLTHYVLSVILTKTDASAAHQIGSEQMAVMSVYMLSLTF